MHLAFLGCLSGRAWDQEALFLSACVCSNRGFVSFYHSNLADASIGIYDLSPLDILS